MSITNSDSDSKATVLEKKPAELKNKSPKYKVLLHNDPVNSMEYVAASLREVVPQLSEQDAISIMLEAHNTGLGLVIVCDLEPAEFYSESLRSKGLTSSIEKED
ncbi:MAG: ATP-dependent Clp protease adapter ClpS [Prochlorococcus sp. SP3034]|nr:ATP-dependent Clp protease adapter ClpS [Prochlorococcus sp. SP3034]|tara:strand:+ start:7665 stop:7976 length:312 start_codon:yes stop_codon:yes gene_type:complete